MFRELYEALNYMGDDHDKYVVFDFDGVCAADEGWEGPDVFGTPVKGVAEFVDELNDKGYKTLLYTVREVNPAMEKWLDDNHFNFSAVNSTEHNPVESGKAKPIAVMYIDDRAVRFDSTKPEESIQQARDLLQVKESIYVESKGTTIRSVNREGKEWWYEDDVTGEKSELYSSFAEAQDALNTYLEKQRGKKFKQHNTRYPGTI